MRKTSLTVTNTRVNELKIVQTYEAKRILLMIDAIITLAQFDEVPVSWANRPGTVVTAAT